MKYILSIFTGILLVSSVAAQTQKLPVQGKLFEDNKPLTATRNFKFSIAALNWEDSLANVPVSEGLYTVELDVPANLFATQKSHDLRIEVNGTQLSTVKIHAPIENDPTVPAYLKDGVSWNEVTDKPVILDLDPANEIQTLTIQGTQLSISGGNTVDLPAGGGNGVFDTLVVGPAKLAVQTAPSIASGSQAEFKPSVTQTFVAESTGRLVSIELYCANSNTAGIEFKVRTVSGGQQVASGVFPPSAFGANFSFQPFAPSSPNAMLTQYVQYIIEVTVTGGATYGFGYDPNDPYKFGQSNIIPGNSADLKFKVNIEKTIGPNMQIDTMGNVGIGIANPTATLHVNGRIKDQTGFLVPVGTIFSFAGSVAPEGWIICDGSAVSRAEYADLFSVIGTTWGDGVDNSTFRVPDLRGEFLRGWDGGTGNDPDNNDNGSGGRYPKYNGVKKGVGSYQTDNFKSHTHGLINGSDTDAGSPQVRPVLAANNELVQPNTLPSGGAETRPRNAAVLYIIKY